MEQKTVKKLLAENLKNIFAYSLSNLYDKESAEDLTNDIICEVLKSAHRLKDDKAFYGFMWKIASNTFKKYIRKEKQNVQFDESFMGVYWHSPEEEACDKEELHLLRRELSLLTKQYREVTVAYYINGKSCSEISHDLSISVEMVKYYLFKTRKILKEGFDMSREYGEKSYNPATFKMDYWGGGDNSCFWNLFKRKLPGNILLAAYYIPMTLRDLSVELGVAVPYLEDEIDILLKHEVIAKIGDKYQTNIIIFTDVCDKEVAMKIKPIYIDMAEKANGELYRLLPELKKLSFYGNNYNDNRLLWTFANLTMVYALNLADNKQKEQFGHYPPLCNGSYGFVFGYDNDYQNHHFNGIYGHCSNKEDTAYFTVENYRVIEQIQKWQPIHWDSAVKAMTDAILEKPADLENDMLIRFIEEAYITSENGKLSAAFPVFTADMIDNTIWNILKPLAEDIADCMAKICVTGAEILKSHAPKALSAKCDQLAHIHYQMDVMAFIIETMVAKKYLLVPETNEKLCIYGVIK